MTQKNGNEATDLLDSLGVAGEQAPKSIPCGYKEPISEGKTLTCGSIYRGETLYCRDCMKTMMANAHEISNSLAEIVLVAFNDHAITGQVAPSTIEAMGQVLESIGCVQAGDEQSH